MPGDSECTHPPLHMSPATKHTFVAMPPSLTSLQPPTHTSTTHQQLEELLLHAALVDALLADKLHLRAL